MLRSRTFSLLTVVAVMMTVPVIAVSALLVQFAGIATRSLAERLGTQLLERHAAAASADLDLFLARIERQSDFAATKFHRGQLAVDDPEAVWPALRAQLEAFPGVSGTYYATPDGRMAGVHRDSDDTISLVRVQDGAAVETRIADADLAEGPAIRAYPFSLIDSPWHRTALANTGPVWTAPFVLPGRDGDSERKIAYVRTLRGADGELAGVIASLVSLRRLGEHLRSLTYLGDGEIIVLDRDGAVVCATIGVPAIGAGANMSPAELAGLAARRDRSNGNEKTIPMSIGGRSLRGLDTDCGTSRELGWSLVAAVPSNAFYGQAWHFQRQLLLISGAVLGISVLLAARLGRGLTRPMMRLREHVHALGEGDFDHRMVIDSLREMEDLNADLNRMAGQLRERLTLRQAIDLATEVQQSLLPRPVLQRPGLDLCGQSQYCDATGGDYYDFLEVVSMGRKSTLVAVGDVMGHGIAAALLMASARAALRAQALQSGSLSSMMDIVNRVLAQSRGRSWFMTMFLLMIDPERRCVRWASAGHTLALVHDPETGETRELGGGDLPLGIDGSVSYQEYSQDDLAPNSILLLGTDGIWETVNEAGEPFGIEPVRQILDTFGDRSAEEIASRLRDAVSAHRGEVRADDDVTFVVVRLTAARIETGEPDAPLRDQRVRPIGHAWPEPSPLPRTAATRPTKPGALE